MPIYKLRHFALYVPYTLALNPSTLDHGAALDPYTTKASQALHQQSDHLVPVSLGKALKGGFRKEGLYMGSYWGDTGFKV